MDQDSTKSAYAKSVIAKSVCSLPAACSLPAVSLPSADDKPSSNEAECFAESNRLEARHARVT
jgi:hypothetical protein